MPQHKDPVFGFIYLIIFILQLFQVALDLWTDKDSLLLTFHIISVLLWYVVVEIWLQPIRRLITYTRNQIYFRHLANLRRTTYIQFRESVKAGTLEADEFEPEAKRVIK